MKYEPCPTCRERGRDSRGDNLVVWPDGGKHCFSCGFHKNASNLRKLITNGEEIRTKVQAHLPDDFNRNVPGEAWKWLLQFGLTMSYWRGRCGYSEKTGRLVFPIESSPGVVAFSIGRRIREDASGRKWYVWGDCHRHAAGLGPIEGPTILVEDWISANKVAEAGFNTLCLFGTEIHNAHLYYLNDGSQREIIYWLDNDQEERMPKRCARLQMLLGRSCRFVNTRDDPKLLPLEDIKQILS